MSRCMIGPKFREEDLTALQPDDPVPTFQCEEKAMHQIEIRLDDAVKKAGEPDRITIKVCDIHFHNLGVRFFGRPVRRAVAEVQESSNLHNITHHVTITFKGKRKT